MTQSKSKPELEHIPKATADALDLHKRNIRSFLAGELKGAAEQFGYAYLAGREMLLAREALPHGNTGDRALGVKKWIAANFPRLAYRTAASRMELARCFNESKDAAALFKSRPLLLAKGKLTVKDRAIILQAVPMVLDGKGMMAFMRAGRLLRDPEKAKHHPRKPVDPEKAAALKEKQAIRLWTGILADIDLGLAVLKHLCTATLVSTVDQLVEASNAIRAQIKTRNTK